MKIRLRGRESEGPRAPTPTAETGAGALAGLQRTVGQRRQFLKLLVTGAGVLGAAGLGQVAVAPQRAFAEIVQSDDVRITGKLTVQGSADSSFVGKLGIGTSTPGQKLQVGNSDGSYALLTSNAGVAYQGGVLLTNAPGYYLWKLSPSYNGSQAGSTLKLSLVAGGALETDLTLPPLFVNGSGSVGVGTTIPVERLDVGGNIRASGSVVSLGEVVLQGSTPVLRFGLLTNDNFRPAVYAYTASGFQSDTLAVAINDVQGGAITPSWNSARIRLVTSASGTADSILFDTRPPNGSYVTRVTLANDGSLKFNGVVAIDPSGVAQQAKQSYYAS